MYSLESVRYGVNNPRKIIQEVNRLYYRRLRSWPYNRDGIDIFEEDWDCLAILDACRYDLFEERSSLPGTLQPVYSRASATKEFLKANFGDRDLLDTVYVTGSPMLYRHQDKINARLHDVVNVWQESGWDDEYRTVLPEVMTDAAIAAREKYPNKRLVVHYLQPHYPFIGPTGREHFDLDQLDFEWDILLRDEIDITDEVVTRAYNENLDVALPHIERLLDELSGKTVVTADHGQVIGERGFPVPVREYGHPPGIYMDGLVKVPWHTYEQGARPEIVAEEQVRDDEADQEQADRDEDVAKERLEQLGYL